MKRLHIFVATGVTLITLWLVTVTAPVSLAFAGISFAQPAMQGERSAATLTVQPTGSVRTGDACPAPRTSAVYAHVQAAIDCAQPGDTISVYPGTYEEAARNRPQFGTGSGSFSFGLYVGTDNLLIQGVNASGQPITSYSDIQAIINATVESSFGVQGPFVSGAGVTISGLRLNPVAPGNNKTLEVVGDAFTLRHSHVTSAGASAIYLRDARFTGSATSGIATLKTYSIIDNLIDRGSIVITNGAGFGQPSSGQIIRGNLIRDTFNWAISVSGSTTITASLQYPVGAPLITDNIFTNNAFGVLRAFGIYDMTDAQINAFIFDNGNTFNNGWVVAYKSDGTSLRTTLSLGYDTRREVGTVIDNQVTRTVDGAGDIVLVGPGTYLNQTVTINRNAVTLRGSGTAQTRITGTNCSGTGITIASSHRDIVVEDLTVEVFQDGINAGQSSAVRTNNTRIEDVNVLSNCRHGIWSQAGNVTGFIINRVDASGNGTANNPSGTNGRGVWFLNGIKNGITITESRFVDNQLNGIDIGTGRVTNLLIENNIAQGSDDTGIAVQGAQGPGTVLIRANTISDNARLGIEIRNPTGTGADSGAGSVVVRENTITGAPFSSANDSAGLVVVRRAPNATFTADQPSGVAVLNNAINNYINAGSGDGFGIVIEGSNHTVSGNTITRADIGLILQAGGTVNATGTDYFDGGSANPSRQLRVRANVITASTDGVRLIGTLGGALNSGNLIYGNTRDGVRILSEESTVFVVNNNQICLNTGLGVRNLGTSTVNARGNWWGSPDGPGPVGPGSGDRVSQRVDFANFITEAPAESPCPDVVRPIVDLSLTKADNADPVLAGDSITYTLTATNDSEFDAANVTIRDDLKPASMTWISGSEGCTVANQVVTCTLGTLPAGESRSVQIVANTGVNAQPQTTRINTATVSTTTPEEVLGNNTAAESTVVNSLTLTALCTDRPWYTRAWRVDNAHPADVTFNYTLNDVLIGTMLVPANGSVIITTDTVRGTENRLSIFVFNVLHDSEVSTGARCTGDLVLTKAVEWNGAPPVNGTTFNLCISGPQYPNGDCKTVTYPDQLVARWDDIQTGTYTLSERDPGADWTVSYSTQQLDVSSTATAQATITNTFKFVPPTGALIITKVIEWSGADPVNGTTFELCVSGPQYPNGDCKTVTYPDQLVARWDGLQTGTYAINERDPGADWAVSYSAREVEVTGNTGTQVVVTNTFKFVPPTGSLKLTKVVDWANAAPVDGTTFKLCIQGASYPNLSCKIVTYPGQLIAMWDGLTPGTYTISEENPGADWAVTYSATALDVAANQTASATVTNTNTAPPFCKVQPGPQSDLRGRMDVAGGVVTGYITNVTDTACVYPVGMALYYAYNSNIDEQYIFASDARAEQRIEAGQTITFTLALPGECYVQADLFYGHLITPMFNGQRYGPRLFVAKHINTHNPCLHLPDSDGDGVRDPIDPSPNVFGDRDGDGIGDGFDPIFNDLDKDGIADAFDDDIDGDAYSNAEEAQAGSDPRDAASVPPPAPTEAPPVDRPPDVILPPRGGNSGEVIRPPDPGQANE